MDKAFTHLAHGWFLRHATRLLLLTGIVMCNMKISSQNIQVFIHIQPNLPVFISEWEIDPSLTNIQLIGSLPQAVPIVVQVVVREFSEGEVISAFSVPIQGAPGAWQLIINNTEFLDWENLDYEEDFERVIAQSGRIPDGDYEICAYVRRDQDPSGPLLGESCMPFTISTQSPPLMLYPVAGDVLTETTPLFQWSYGSHAPGVNYILKLVEVFPNQSVEEAIVTNITILDHTTDQLLFLFEQATAFLHEGYQYAVWVETPPYSGHPPPEQLRSEGVPFYWLKSCEPSITPVRPGALCEGNINSSTLDKALLFEWTTTGMFSSFHVVTCKNPCGRYKPPDVITPSGGVGKPTPTEGGGKKPSPSSSGPQYPDVPSVDVGWERLRKIVSEAIANAASSLGELQFISNGIIASTVNECESMPYSITMDMTEILQPGEAFTWFVVGVTSTGTVVSSPTFCHRYAPLDTHQDIPEDMPCPFVKECIIKLDENVLPNMDGGLKKHFTGEKEFFRDEFIPLEAEGRDYDKLTWNCIRNKECVEEENTQREWPLTSRVKFEWEITAGEGRFKKLGCLPDNLMKEQGEHVILQPPFVPLPAGGSPETRITRILLTITDDNPTQKIDAQVKRKIMVETTRKKDAPDKYFIKITAENYSLPAAPAADDKLKPFCQASMPDWRNPDDLTPPSIILPPGIPDNDKMVVGEMMQLMVDDQRDKDELRIKCISNLCTGSEEKKIYEDDVAFVWSIVKGPGVIWGNAAGRTIIYQAPGSLPDAVFKEEVTIKCIVKNPNALKKEDVPREKTISFTVHNSGISVSHPDPKWLPTDTGKVTLTSSLKYAIGTKDDGLVWEEPLAHQCRIHFMELTKVSEEPGIALNVPLKNKADECIDLYLKNETGDNHEAFMPQPKTASCDIKELFQQARTKYPVKKYSLKVYSRDFGSYGFLRSYANAFTHPKEDGQAVGCMPFYRSISVKKTDVKHPDGKREKANVFNDNRVTIPMDIDENHIRDSGWVSTVDKVVIPDPDKILADEDANPNPTDKGDGFSNYEEYRGVKVINKVLKPEHRRLNMKKKDLFVCNENKLLLDLFEGASKLLVHQITAEQYNQHTSRMVNANHKTAHSIDMRGLRLIANAGGGNLEELGKTRPIMGAAAPNTPFNILEIIVYTKRIKNWCNQNKVDESTKTKWTIAHELAHGCNVHHHGEMHLHQPNPIGGNLPLPCPHAPQGPRSGDVSCIMRYDNLGDPWPSDVLVGCPPKMPKPEGVGSIFCTAAAGTGYNAGPACFGNANKGDCFHQIRLRH